MIMSLISIKVQIISAGILVSLAMGITIFSVHEIPVMWWLKPPYLHLITNAIIISIVASARFRRTQSDEHPPEQYLITVKTPPSSYYGSLSAIYTLVEDSTADESEDRVVELEPTAVNGSSVFIVTKEVLDEAKVDSVPSTYNSPWQEIISPDQPQLELLSPHKKPVLSPRSCHGNLIKTSPDEGAKVSCAIPFPGVKTPREPETLESIWKMITEKNQADRSMWEPA